MNYIKLFKYLWSIYKEIRNDTAKYFIIEPHRYECVRDIGSLSSERRSALEALLIVYGDGQTIVVKIDRGYSSWSKLKDANDTWLINAKSIQCLKDR